MELESKNPDLQESLLENDSQAANPQSNLDNQVQEENGNVQDNISSINTTNHQTSSNLASMNFDEMPLPSKATLSFDELLEASLKGSNAENIGPVGKRELASRPPKPKTNNAKFIRGAAQKQQNPNKMEEELPANVEPKVSHSNENMKISFNQDKIIDETSNSENFLMEKKNHPEGMNIEEEKTAKEDKIHEEIIPQNNESSGLEPIDIEIQNKPPSRRSSQEFPKLNKGKDSKNKAKQSFGDLDEYVQNPADQNFDEVPVGKGTGIALSEFPEGMQPFEENSQQTQDTGPLQNRIKSKVWKVRQTAFEELTQKFQDAEKDDHIFDEYGGELPKLLNDANPGAQEKAIEAFKVYVEKRNGSGIDGKAVVKTLVDKALAPGKPNIKKITFEAFYAMFEKMDKKEIMEGLVDSINHKNQKVSCAGVQAVVDLLITFGPRKLELLKPFFQSIEKLAASTVSSQRNEAMNFYKEAYKFMGEALKPFISNLKKAQIDELEKFFNECPKELSKPIKEDEAAMTTSASGNVGRSASGAIDAYDIADAVDIFKKFNESWSEKVLAKEKWNEKKTMLEELLKDATNTPRIAASSFPHITNLLKKTLTDSNQQVMITSIKIYGALAKGLRRNLANACKNIMPNILGKLKDKKPVVEETTKTLENFLYCIGIEEVIDDVKEILADKAPAPKISTMKWIEKYFEKNSKTPEKLLPAFKGLLPILKKLLEDGSAEVRDSSLQTLAKLKFLLTESLVKESYNDINPTKLTRINELVSSFADGKGLDENTKGNSSNLSVTMPTSKKNKPNLTLNESMEEEKSSIIKKPEFGKKLDNKPQTSRANAPGAKQLQGGLKKVGSMKLLGSNDANKENQDLTSAVTADEAEAKMVELNVPESIMKGIVDSVWKERQRAIEELSSYIKENVSIMGPYVEHTFKFVQNKLKDWKESNLNVVKETFNFILSVCENEELTLNKRSFNIIVPLISGNLADSKYNEICFRIVSLYVESITPKSVILSLINSIQDSKDPKAKVNPKALVEMCNLMVRLMEMLTLSYFPLKETINFSKAILANQNVQARNAAINLLKSIYQQLGNPLNDFLTDVNPQTLKNLNAEFEKVTVNKNIQCKVQFRGEAQTELKEQGGQSTNPLDSLPRGEISKDADKLLKKLNDSKWEVRREALENLQSLLTANNNRISPNGLQELVTALKGRLNDNNKSLVKSCIHFVGNFATALGSNARVYSKPLIQELAKNLLDKQVAIRTETLAALDKFAVEIGSESVINITFPLLNQENPELRQTLIPWIIKNQESLNKVDLRSYVGIVLSILQDRIKEIRNLGERLLEKCIGEIGAGPYISALKDLKPAIQKNLSPIIQKYSNTTASSGIISTEPDIETDLQNTSYELKHHSRTLNKIPSESSMRTAKSVPRQGTKDTAMVQETPATKKTGRPGSPPKKVTTPNSSLSNIQINTSSSGLNTSGVNSARNMNTGMINFLGQKAKRQEEEKKAKWNTEDLRDDMVERLKDHLKKNVSNELYQKMFSFDARKQVEAIQCLKKTLVQEFQGTIDILDLIIRWLFFRLWDNSNMVLIKEALDFVFNLTLSLAAAGFTLEDFELNVLVVFLLQRLTGGNQSSRVTLHKIFENLGEIVTCQKVSSQLIQNLHAKNLKIRNEALEVLLNLVKEYKANAISTKDIKTLGKLLGHTDTVVRNLVFNVFVELGLHMKDDLFRVLKGEAPQKALETLYQKVKNAEGGHKVERRGFSDDFSASMYGESVLGDYKGTSTVSHSFILDKENTYDFENVENRDVGNFKRGSFQEKPISRDNVSTVESKENIRDTRDNSLSGTPQTIVKGHVIGGQRIEEELFDRSLNLLINGSMSSRLDALLLIHDIVTADNEETRDFLKVRSNDLVLTLKTTLKNVFNKPKQEIPLKFAFYFLNMTHKLCSIRAFLKNISEENLRIFSEELLQRLLTEDEEKRFDPVDNDSMVKTLNSIMLRVLENADQDAMFSVLFDLLIKNRRQHTYAKVLGLIVKCILKLTKALSQFADSFHPEIILLKFHLYILEFGAKQAEDIGIKTIKTVLNELSRVYHEELFDYYARAIQTHPKPDEYIISWLNVIMRGNSVSKDESHHDDQQRSIPIKKEEEVKIKKPEMASMNVLPQSFSSLGSDTGSKENENDEIKKIIDNLKISEDMEDSIKQLHQTMKKHPGVSINSYLKNSTPALSEYVLKTLERLDARENMKSSEIYKPKFPISMSNENSQQEDSRSRFQLDEDKFRSGKQSQEVISPRNSGSNTLSLEDFQNKVNTLKARYGLMMKKTPEIQEPTRSNQTTLIYKSTPNSNMLEKREPSREPEKKTKVEIEGKDSSVIGGLGGGRFAPKSSLETGTGSLPTGSKPVERQGSIEPVSRADTGVTTKSNGSTESILQRLSEMKMKMANIVNSSKNPN